MTPQTVWLGFALVTGALVIAGCGRSASENLDVPGQILKNGEPLRAKEIKGVVVGKILVRFYRETNGKFDVRDVHGAGVNPRDGTFTVKNLPAGRYKITVSWKDDPVLGEDLLKDAFSFKNSKIIRDIKGHEKQEIDIGRTEG